jgi:hypothetical protein
MNPLRAIITTVKKQNQFYDALAPDHPFLRFGLFILPVVTSVAIDVALKSLKVTDNPMVWFATLVFMLVWRIIGLRH